MTGHDIVVIGGSAGGVSAVRTLITALPADFPAAVFVVIHQPPDAAPLLASLLNHDGPLAATNACDGEAIRYGRVYVAPPNRHLLIEEGAVRLSTAPKVHFSRPSIDVLFRAAAQAHGQHVVGVVLSGKLHDGMAGLAAVGERGGVTVVQDPAEALHAEMPSNAIQYRTVDHILPTAEIAALLVRLIRPPQNIEQARE